MKYMVYYSKPSGEKIFNDLQRAIIRFLAAHNRKLISAADLQEMMNFLLEGIKKLNERYKDLRPVQARFEVYDYNVPHSDFYLAGVNWIIFHLLECTEGVFKDENELAEKERKQ